MARPFLTARWRYLAMLNYEIDPGMLRQRVPRGTELDVWGGRTLVSVVGFLFLNTRVGGWAVPGHRDFEEVNLRFYVRREVAGGWRRGVVFVKEIVPRLAIAAVARLCFQENYVALPMRHRVARAPGQGETPDSVEYSWRHRGRWHHLGVRATGDPASPAPGSEEEFVTEHYWGYVSRRDGASLEYRVEHPPWRVWQVAEAALLCEVAGLYDPEFGECLGARPSSAFLAEGSPVVVWTGERL